MNSNLFDFCIEADVKIVNAPPAEKIEIFCLYRYFLLAKSFPHDTFSVEQCSFDFFVDTALYLKDDKQIDSKERNKSEYTKNYFDWIDKNK